MIRQFAFHDLEQTTSQRAAVARGASGIGLGKHCTFVKDKKLNADITVIAQNYINNKYSILQAR